MVRISNSDSVTLGAIEIWDIHNLTEDAHPIHLHFDRAGLYVWHSHLVEHADNEMMRPTASASRDQP